MRGRRVNYACKEETTRHFLVPCFKEQCRSMDEMIDLRAVKAGGASCAVEVNLAAFLLTRVYWKSTAETAVSI